MKTAIAFYTQLPTTHGIQAPDRYARSVGVEAKPVVWTAEIRARERDGYVKKLQEQIDATQKKLDSYNFQTSFEIEVPQEDEYSASVEVPQGTPVAATSDPDDF